jgi:putative ABC transport system ATP-binding protein
LSPHHPDPLRPCSIIWASVLPLPEPLNVSPNDSPIVACAGVNRRFGEGQAAVDALRGVSLELPHGELAGVVGPSGSGKSTLMHILAGLDRPTSGSVRIAGTEITTLDDRHLTELRRDKLGFVFQFFNLVPVLDAEENIALPVRIAGRDVDQAWVESLMDTVGIRDRRNHLPSELSGGQQQRVAIARALVTRPAVVFADEPTGNLDSKSGADVLALLRRSVDEFGQTVMMVTHDPRVASFADRVIVLTDGQISHDGRVDSPDGVLQLMQAV